MKDQVANSSVDVWKEYGVQIVKEECEYCEGSDILVELQSCI